MQELLLFPLGLIVGIVSTVSGGSSLISFPALLALGYSPVQANVTSTVGLSGVGIGSSIGFRNKLRDDREILTRLLVASALGGLIGGATLLAIGDKVFDAIVPFLLAFGSALILLQPWLTKTLTKHREDRDHIGNATLGTFITGAYNGFFGAGAGVLIVAVFVLFLRGGMQRAVTLKSVVAMFANLTAVLFFLVFAPVATLRQESWQFRVSLADGSERVLHKNSQINSYAS